MTTSSFIPETVNGRRAFRVAVLQNKRGAKVQVWTRFHASRDAAVESANEVAREEGFRVIGVYEGAQGFTLNGERYTADEETVRTLRTIVDSAKATGDGSAVIAMIALGMLTGRVSKEAA